MVNYSQDNSLNATKHFIKYRPNNKDYYEEEKHLGYKCRFCGKPMYIYRKVGNVIQWSCETEGCFGNINTKRPDVSNAEYIKQMNKIGRVSNFWKNMRPIV